MSYSLVFWKAAPSVSPGRTWAELEEGQPVPQVELANTAAIEEALATELRDGWERVDRWIWAFRPDRDGNGPAADVSVETQYVSITCFGLEGAQMNQIIDALFPLGYRLFDPQTGERFDSDLATDPLGDE